MFGVDYSWARPSVQALKSAGTGFVCRYLSGHRSKDLSAAEAAKLAQECGMPPGRPIFFAVDFDAPPGNQAAINCCLERGREQYRPRPGGHCRPGPASTSIPLARRTMGNGE